MARAQQSPWLMAPDGMPNDLDIPRQLSWEEMASRLSARDLNMWGLVGNGPSPGDPFHRRSEGGMERDADRRR